MAEAYPLIYKNKQYYKYWGKVNISKRSEDEYHLLVYHCLDVAAVGNVLLSLDPKRCIDISTQTGLCPGVIRYMVVFTLMLHDLGKFSKSFQSLHPILYKNFFSSIKSRKYEERHDTLGFLIWRGDPGSDSKSVLNILTHENQSLARLLDIIIKTGFGHHGIPPKESGKGGSLYLWAKDYFDYGDWSAVKDFVLKCLEIMGKIPKLPTDIKPLKKLLKGVSWQIAGLNIISDWIGSNTDYFPYCSNEIPLEEYWDQQALPNAERALKKIRWRSASINNFQGIGKLFPFITEPTPLQELAANMELQKGPKLFILEDVTGAGKTEAAVIIASRIMNSGAAEGLYIGLPTMATANQMYQRMKDPYRKLYHDNQNPSLILSHGARHLSKDFTESLAVQKQLPDISHGDENTGSAWCNEWYADNRKKALLADVGVGTIDQALIGVLPARHQALRLLGLSRKILIVDEVHAYDQYTGHLLEVLVEAHARGGGSVILLSATIPLKKRTNLINAFRNGLNCDDQNITKELENGFPCLTQVSASGVESSRIESRREVCRNVGVSFIHRYTEAIDRICKKARGGECVCWIRNTVKDARKTYQDLIKKGIPKSKIDLFHSRFAMIDRLRIEEKSIRNFGRDSGPDERNGRILISTQVVEQSLDLDFDAMISDLAPIDLLIQRAGRLHRHVRNRYGEVKKTPGATDERGNTILYVFAPEFDENADSSWLSGEFAGTAAVYRDVGVLWRTQKIFFDNSGKKKGWAMPEDARKLIESVYGDGYTFEVPKGLENKVYQAEGEAKSKTSMGHLNALILEKGYQRNATRASQWDEDERVPTRLSEDNYEVVLVVDINDLLQPYAVVESHAWDWSSLSVSISDWEKAGYVLPQKYKSRVEELKASNSRLKFCEIVVVKENSEKAPTAAEPISEHYHPYLGWGEFKKED
jgi:CRISPR-associated endonuclease/helicase Cas3